MAPPGSRRLTWKCSAADTRAARRISARPSPDQRNRPPSGLGSGRPIRASLPVRLPSDRAGRPRAARPPWPARRTRPSGSYPLARRSVEASRERGRRSGWPSAAGPCAAGTAARRASAGTADPPRRRNDSASARTPSASRRRRCHSRRPPDPGTRSPSTARQC